MKHFPIRISVDKEKNFGLTIKHPFEKGKMLAIPFSKITTEEITFALKNLISLLKWELSKTT